jgi:hypothetical protein
LTVSNQEYKEGSNQKMKMNILYLLLLIVVTFNKARGEDNGYIPYNSDALFPTSTEPDYAPEEDNDSKNNKNDDRSGQSMRGVQLVMRDCPNKCLSYNSTDGQIDLRSCRTAGNDKLWELEYDCGRESFFRLRNVNYGLCIVEPESCTSCNKEITLVSCDSDQAALFSYGNLHKIGERASYLYSARCWLNEGEISVLSTPSLDSKSGPKDFTNAACGRLEWNLDRFNKDVLYYEWAMNRVRADCDAELHNASEKYEGYFGMTVAFSSAAAAIVIFGLGMKSRQVMTLGERNKANEGVVEQDPSPEVELVLVANTSDEKVFSC